MIKPDIITIYPRSFFYPEFHAQVIRQRDLFKKVILVYTHNSYKFDFRPFIYQNFQNLTFVDTEFLSMKEWYQTAVNEGIKESSSEWVLFLEQDFWYTPEFMKSFLEKCEGYDFCALEDSSNRLHLACFAVKRHLIEQTMKYFFTLTTKRFAFDCFDLFTTELQALTKNFATLQVLGFVDGKDFHHMSGLTQNYHLFITGEPEGVTNKKQFAEYNQRCLNLTIPQPDEWVNLMNKVKAYSQHWEL